MKIKNILLSFALIVVFHVFTQAQKVKTEKEVVSGNEISNSDSLKGTNMLPSEKIYGNLWDTLYIRLSRNAKVSVNDSVILKLLAASVVLILKDSNLPSSAAATTYVKLLNAPIEMFPVSDELV